MVAAGARVNRETPRPPKALCGLGEPARPLRGGGRGEAGGESRGQPKPQPANAAQLFRAQGTRIAHPPVGRDRRKDGVDQIRRPGDAWSQNGWSTANAARFGALELSAEQEVAEARLRPLHRVQVPVPGPQRLTDALLEARRKPPQVREEGFRLAAFDRRDKPETAARQSAKTACAAGGPQDPSLNARPAVGQRVPHVVHDHVDHHPDGVGVVREPLTLDASGRHSSRSDQVEGKHTRGPGLAAPGRLVSSRRGRPFG